MAAEANAAEAEAVVYPGLKFFVWPKAYIEAAQAVVNKVFEVEALKTAYGAYIHSNDIQVTQLVKPTTRIDIHEGKLRWILDNAYVTVHGRRRDRNGEEVFDNRISGSFEIGIRVVRSGPFYSPIYSAKVDSTNLTFYEQYSQGSDGSGGSNVNSSSSSGSRKRTADEAFVGDTVCYYTKSSRNSHTHMTTSRGKCTTIVSGQGSSDNDLSAQIVRGLVKAVLESLNDRLPDHSFPLGTSCDWMFDFSCLAKPRFWNGIMCSPHRGAFHYSEDPMPVQALPFPMPRDSGRMLTFYLSNYLFNTIGCRFHEHGLLNYNLKQEDLAAPPAAQGHTAALDAPGTTTARLLSDCFPDFQAKYPGASVEIDMDTIEAPTAKFSAGGHLKVDILGSASFLAQLLDGSTVNFLSTEVSMEVMVLLNFLRVDKLMGSVTSVVPSSITVAATELGSLNRDVLRETFDLIAAQFLKRKFEELMESGIPLPRPLLPRIEEFENLVVSTMAEDRLRIDTDLKFND